MNIDGAVLGLDLSAVEDQTLDFSQLVTDGWKFIVTTTSQSAWIVAAGQAGLKVYSADPPAVDSPPVDGEVAVDSSPASEPTSDGTATPEPGIDPTAPSTEPVEQPAELAPESPSTPEPDPEPTDALSPAQQYARDNYGWTPPAT